MPALLKPRVVIDADPGKLRNFFPAKAWNPASAGQRSQTDGFGGSISPASS